jgi:catechol 2,3-dioxygenase-like lactoylglutathione lyase family enzyme
MAEPSTFNDPENKWVGRPREKAPHLARLRLAGYSPLSSAGAPANGLAAFSADHLMRAPRAARRVTIRRMDNVLIVVDDLEAAKAFFVALGMTLVGETTVEGPWADRVVGLKNVRADIVMMRTPDGHGQVELSKFHAPAAVRFGPVDAPSNTLGMRRIMFAVDDLDATLAGLRAVGASLVDEVAQYEDAYRLCFVRGPEGIVVGLAEELG